MKPKITVAYGDGIGPEIMTATLKILRAAGAQFEEDRIEVGEKLYLEGNTSGIRAEDWKKIVENKVFLKAPITTPQGGGYKSLNVTIRKTLGLFANVRPVQTLSPYVKTKHPKMDLVIIRENEEDLYAGIEHRQTDEVYQCLKLISVPGCEKIVRYAFEYARRSGRKKVTCMTKDNIMKLTDGLFHKKFDEIAAEYPEIENEHWIIDIGAAKLADTPEIFDVVVMPNLYGDILSDVAAQIAGSVGLAGSSNIGQNCAMFEAIHGSAPGLAGQNIANPSGLLQGSVLMLTHLGQSKVAEKIQNAWLKTIEDGVHTFDVFDTSTSTKKVGTAEFAEAVIERLGQKPQKLKVCEFSEETKPLEIKTSAPKMAKKFCEGIDVFIHERERNPDWIGDRLRNCEHTDNFELKMITNRGIKVYPDGNPETFCTDHWRCRFIAKDGINGAAPVHLWKLLSSISKCGFDIIKTENLYTFDGERGYSLGQGQ